MGSGVYTSKYYIFLKNNLKMLNGKRRFPYMDNKNLLTIYETKDEK